MYHRFACQCGMSFPRVEQVKNGRFPRAESRAAISCSCPDDGNIK